MPEPQKEEFNWIELRKEFYENLNAETGTQKLVRKCKEAPLVPIGNLHIHNLFSKQLQICNNREKWELNIAEM